MIKTELDETFLSPAFAFMSHLHSFCDLKSKQSELKIDVGNDGSIDATFTSTGLKIGLNKKMDFEGLSLEYLILNFSSRVFA